MSATTYGAGAATFGNGTGSMGAPLTDTPVTSSWQENMRAAAAKIRAKYADPSHVTVGMLTPDVDHWWQIATRYSTEAGQLSTMTPDRQRKAQDNAIKLLELRGLLRQRNADELVAPSDVAAAVTAMTAPIEWLVTVGKPVLENEERSAIPWKLIMWVTIGGAGLYLAAKFLHEVNDTKREIAGPEPIFRRTPTELVSNPPMWARDVDIWESARLAVEPYKGGYRNADAVITHVYKQMGGRVE